MGKLPEPDDVDIFVNGGDPDPESIQEMVEHIKEYKKRPEYPEEIREARKTLEALETNSPEYRMPDAAALLEQHQALATPNEEARPDEVDPEVALSVDKELDLVLVRIRDRLLRQIDRVIKRDGGNTKNLVIRFGVVPGTVSRWRKKNPKRPPSLRSIFALTEGLGLSYEWVWRGVGPVTREEVVAKLDPTANTALTPQDRDWIEFGRPVPEDEQENIREILLMASEMGPGVAKEVLREFIRKMARMSQEPTPDEKTVSGGRGFPPTAKVRKQHV